jgi:hypothetical protein
MQLILMLMFWLASPAHAAGCDEPLQLEAVSYIGGLSARQEACLQDVLTTTDPETRAQVSFMLIIHAYMKGEEDVYEERMRTHLTQFHTRDAEVAYLYATWLKDEMRHGEELIKWAKVALEGRFRWLHNRNNYIRMVQSLYDMLNEACLVAAAKAQVRMEQSPSETNRTVFETKKQRARYYLIVSGPCLYKGDCFPKYDVEIEGAATCADLYDLAARAEHGKVTPDELACLRAKYRRPTTNKRRVLEVMSSNAKTDESGRQFEALLEWHHRMTGETEPNLAADYAGYLINQGPIAAKDAITWADVALTANETLRGGTEQRGELYALRVAAARALVHWAEKVDAEGTAGEDRAPPPEEAVELLVSVQAEHQAWCTENPRSCAGE